MSGKVIWFVNHYAGGPGIGRAFRPYYLSRYWQKDGYKVYVITASFHHLMDKNESLSGGQVVNGVNYVFLDTPSYHGNGLGRIRNMLSFSYQLLADKRLGSGGIPAPDVVIASSPHPYAIFSVKRLARRYGAFLVFEVRDLWPLSLVELSGVSPIHPLVALTAITERYAYRIADHVVSLLSNAETYMRRRGLKEGRFTYIPNGVSIEHATFDTVDDSVKYKSGLLEAIQEFKSHGKFLVGYTGAHGEPNNLGVLLHSAKRLQDQERENVHFILVGKGDYKCKLMEQADGMGLSNVSFYDAVSKQEILSILKYFDVGFISLLPKPLFKYGISPNKLFDYMLSRLPVLYAVEAGNHPVREAACGVEVSPGSSEEIAGAISDLMNLPQCKLREMGSNGRSYVERYHDFSRLAKRYTRIFEQAQ